MSKKILFISKDEILRGATLVQKVFLLFYFFYRKNYVSPEVSDSFYESLYQLLVLYNFFKLKKSLIWLLYLV